MQSQNVQQNITRLLLIRKTNRNVISEGGRSQRRAAADNASTAAGRRRMQYSCLTDCIDK